MWVAAFCSGGCEIELVRKKVIAGLARLRFRFEVASRGKFEDVTMDGQLTVA